MQDVKASIAIKMAEYPDDVAEKIYDIIYTELTYFGSIILGRDYLPTARALEDVLNDRLEMYADGVYGCMLEEATNADEIIELMKARQKMKCSTMAI